MNKKLKRYEELKQHLEEYNERPIGDRIKKGGLLEQKIREKFNKATADKVLTRSNDSTDDKFHDWNRLRDEFFKLKYELEEEGVINE